MGETSHSSIPRADKGLLDASDGMRPGAGPNLRRVLANLPSQGLSWAILGGAVSVLSTAPAAALVAFGLSCAAGEGRTRRAFLAFLAALAAASLAAAAYDLPRLVTALPALASALALVLLADETGITASRACVLVLVSAAVTLGSSAAVAASQGTSVPASMEAYAASIVAATSGSQSLALREEVGHALFLVRTYWPLAYLASGGLLAAFSKLGRDAWLRGRGIRPRRTPLANFDAPLWVLPAFVVGLALSAASSRLTGLPAGIGLAGRNLLAAARVVLFLQGCAVAVGFLKRRDAGVATQAVAVMVAAWLELSFVIVSAVGAVDLVANFRGLPRRRTSVG